MTSGSRATPLLNAHRELGARLTEFAGWDMPLQYEGVISEHNAVRSTVGIGDVSHLGKLRVAGSSAEGALQVALTADVGALEVGRATYSLVLTEAGGCVDDVFAYRMGPDEWLVVPNAANVDAVARAIAESGVTPDDEWDRWAILAIQGPDSFGLFNDAFPSSQASDLTLHGWCDLDVFGEPGLVARTGYTGERGYELYAPAATAPKAFSALLAAGATPVGLGARDTLRLEMGYALYGHELGLDMNPLEAGLGWTLGWDTPFRGSEALAAIKVAGRRRRTFGVRCRGRGVPRQGYEVVAGDDVIATVTSGNFSPTLGTGIALALGPIESVPEVGAQVAVRGRGRDIEGDIVKPPFIQKG